MPSFAKAPARRQQTPKFFVRHGGQAECTSGESLCSPLVLVTAAADLLARSAAEATCGFFVHLN
jgi:hypothetical protein